jgi:hypothetical protein
MSANAALFRVLAGGGVLIGDIISDVSPTPHWLEMKQLLSVGWKSLKQAPLKDDNQHNIEPAYNPQISSST